jgi:hypothetical protein
MSRRAEAPAEVLAELIERYCAGESVPALAAESGILIDRLRAEIRWQSIEREQDLRRVHNAARLGKELASDEALVSSYRQGASVTEIARQWRIDPNRVYRIVRAAERTDLNLGPAHHLARQQLRAQSATEVQGSGLVPAQRQSVEDLTSVGT